MDHLKSEILISKPVPDRFRNPKQFQISNFFVWRINTNAINKITCAKTKIDAETSSA
jgi:hypothetical protein